MQKAIKWDTTHRRKKKIIKGAGEYSNQVFEIKIKNSVGSPRESCTQWLNC